MLKVGIVGCGKIADEHAGGIQRLGGAKVVAACDREPLMARQFCDRFGVPEAFTDVAQMLDKAKPDVVHVTTPPQSHFNVAMQCLQAGAHVYVEKPFTIDAGEARELVRTAEKLGLKLTAGHDCQFRNAARRMRALVRTGYLGGDAVHMESYFCYEMSGGYAAVLLADKNHWVRRMPGQLLQNIISHGVSRIAEFLKTDSPEVIAHGFTSPMLRDMGETEIVDELRVVISEEKTRTAYFTFSTQMHPSLHQFRVYGPKNGLIIDQDQETLIKLPGTKRKSYLEQFVTPREIGRQYFENSWHNIKTFLRRDFHPKEGMKHLIEEFHNSIVNDTPAPIPYREIVLTAWIMDEIFNQVYARKQQPEMVAATHR
ncbi:MAG: Gfo/Idh/MocA family protein [Terriglobales bacterium]